jgi:hypothetical protein
VVSKVTFFSPDKFLINFHGAQTNVHPSIDQFMQLTHEVKVCHGDYLVNHLPHSVCDNYKLSESFASLCV